MSSFTEYFEQHVASALARQMALGDLIGDRGWGIDTQSGILNFGNGELEFGVQLLGSHAFEAGTWMWIWANAQSGIPEPFTRAAEQLRQWGEEQKIPELTEAVVPMGTVTDHMLAMTCGGLLDGRCYYRAPYSGGALFVLLDEVPPHITRPVAPARALTVLGEVISQFDVRHRPMAESFLRQQQFDISETTAERFIATRAGEGTIELSFDAAGRLSNMAGKLGSEPPAAKPAPPRWQFWKR